MYSKHQLKAEMVKLHKNIRPNYMLPTRNKLKI